VPIATTERGTNAYFAGLLVLSLGAFVVLLGLSALAYPGGTYCDPHADGYRFWGNYFCDLTATVSVRGEDNARSAAFSEAAFTCFSASAGTFFWLLGGMSRRVRLVRTLGVISASATAALAWLPSRSGPSLHAITVFTATLPGLGAAGVGLFGALVGARKPRTRAVAWLGVATFAAGVVDAAGYAYAVAVRAGCLPWLPALQKVVALCLLSWMFATAFVSFRPERPQTGRSSSDPSDTDGSA
jgi:hypothetical protein